MTDKPENPPALASLSVDTLTGNINLSAQMTLRDYFAAAALTGYRCAYHQWYEQVGATGKMAEPEELARWSYADADAMLKEREQ